eukprot:PhM_4_TR3400/c3_g2_i1/m.29733
MFRLARKQGTAGLVPMCEFTVTRPDGSACRVRALAGSVLEYQGDAIVNAANTGGVAGFGIDEMVNRAGGPELIMARRRFRGIDTGEAKICPAFNHKKAKFIIHAVGPCFPRLSSEHIGLPPSRTSEAEKEVQLAKAYENALLRAAENDCHTVGFCLISAGVFRGKRTLGDVLGIAVQSIAATVAQLPSLSEVALCAFTVEEQSALANVMERVSANVSSSRVECSEGNPHALTDGTQD